MSEPKRREEELFLAALEISDALQRAAYLKGACGKDTGLHAQLLELLAAHDATQGPLDRSPAASFQSPTVAHQVSTLAGTMIASKYKLVEPIGEGGMGSVWLAEQREPVKRLVAIKLIKAGMDSKAVLARFEAERQALALMDHPNIARILDGGVTESGLPYFVMELVKGVPITQFCDARKLTPQQRLELFVPVCQAIQHAHQKGIIHRDIKPSNVMVSLYDDRPVPKVIDFGVAKATGHALTEQTLITGFSVVGTPQYMSPEQATFNQLDIDTRSDIYSLGVLLYELLVGSPPFQKQELEKAGYLEILRVIREDEPPRPSTKLSTAKGLPSLSASRSTEPKKLTGLLRNELDWIVMKALEKDRTRRYETANGFAADVQRYLAGEQVLAHPPSVRYRIQKFVRRNRGRVLAAGLLMAALLVGITGTTLGLVRATKAESKATTALGQVTEEQAKTKAALGEVIEEKVKTEQALVKATEEEQKAKATDADSRKKLARQYIDQGWKLINDGNVTEALHWYIAAFAKEQDLIDKERERVHRTRIAATMEACPRPTHILFHTAPVRRAAYSPDGRKLVTLAWNTEDKMELRIWDALSGKQIGPVISPPDIGAESMFRNGLLQLQFDISSTKVMLVRRQIKLGLPFVLDVWDARTGQTVGHPTAMANWTPDASARTANYPKLDRPSYMEFEFTDPAKPVWPPKLGRHVDLDTLRRTELPPVMDNAMRAWRTVVDPTGRYCVVPPSADGDCELWALNPLRRIARWGDGKLTGRTSENVPILTESTIKFTPDGNRFLCLLNVERGKKTLIYSIESSTGRELFPALSLPQNPITQGVVPRSCGFDITPDASRFLIDAVYDGIGEVTIHDAVTGKSTGRYRPPSQMTVAEASFDLSGTQVQIKNQFLSAPKPITSTNIFDIVPRPQPYMIEILDAVTGLPIGPPVKSVQEANLAGNNFTLSSDGSKILTRDEKGLLTLGDLRTGESIVTLASGQRLPKFGSDGRLLALLEDDAVRIWDTQTGRPTSSILNHRAKVTGFEFSPTTDQLYTICEDGTVRLWDTIPNSSALEVLVPSVIKVVQVAPVEDRVTIQCGAGSSGFLQLIWDVAGDHRNQPYSSPSKILDGIDCRFAAGGHTVFASHKQNGFSIWEASSGRLLQQQSVRSGEEYQAALSSDGQRIVTIRTPDGEAQWWNAATGEPIGNKIAGNGTPIQVGYNSGYRHDHSKPFLVTLRFRTEPGSSLEVEPTVWDPTRDSPTVLPWRAAAAGFNVTGKDSSKPPFKLPLLPIFAGGRTLDPMTGPDGLSAGWRLVEDATGGELASLPPGKDATFIARGSQIAILGTSHLSIWNAANGQEVSSIPVPRSDFTEFRFNNDGSRVIITPKIPGNSRYKSVFASAPQLWDVLTGRTIAPPMTQSDPLVGFEWSPDGRWIATWTATQIQVWETNTGRECGSPIRLRDAIRQVRFSPDGKTLATVTPFSAGRSTAFRDAMPFDHSINLSGMIATAIAMVHREAFETSGQLCLWDVSSGEPVAPPVPNLVLSQPSEFGQASKSLDVGPVFSGNGLRLYTTPTPRSVRAWTIPIDERPLSELVATAEALSGRRFRESGNLSLLSPEEWRAALNRTPGTTAPLRSIEQRLARERDRAEILYAGNDWEGALGHVNRLISAGSNEAKHYQIRGWCRYMLNIPDGALADMNRAVELGAGGWEIWAQRGIIHAARKQFQLAAEDYLKMAQFPDSTVPKGLESASKIWWPDVARLLSWGGHPKEYRWACDRLLAIEGLKPLYTNGEFIVFLDSPNGLDDYTPIVTNCRDELEKDKRVEQIPKLKSRLGLALLRSKQFAEAVKIIESIDNNALPSINIYRRGANELVLAMAYHHLGNREQAEHHLQNGLEQTGALEKDIQSGAITVSLTQLLMPSTLAREAKQLIREEPKAITVPPMPVEK